MPDVVTCAILHGEKLLILKRSDKVGTYRNKWACVSGFVEKGENVLERAFREIKEETQLGKKDVTVIKQGSPIIFYDRHEQQTWQVFPFLFSAKTQNIKPDWEHSEYAWVYPQELHRYDTVPKLREAILSLLDH